MLIKVEDFCFVLTHIARFYVPVYKVTCTKVTLAKLYMTFQAQKTRMKPMTLTIKNSKKKTQILDVTETVKLEWQASRHSKIFLAYLIWNIVSFFIFSFFIWWCWLLCRRQAFTIPLSGNVCARHILWFNGGHYKQN